MPVDAEILIRGAAALVTMDASRAELAGADLLIRGGVIAAVGHRLQARGRVVEAAGFYLIREILCLPMLLI